MITSQTKSEIIKYIYKNLEKYPSPNIESIKFDKAEDIEIEEPNGEIFVETGNDLVIVTLKNRWDDDKMYCEVYTEMLEYIWEKWEVEFDFDIVNEKALGL